MHEIAFCKSILEIVLAHAKKNHASKIKKIYIAVGELLQLDQSAMCFGFSVAASKTVAEGARLDFIIMPAKIFCDDCQRHAYIKNYGDSCVFCGKNNITIVSGEECHVQSMEVE